jgi:hypothetical protein
MPRKDPGRPERGDTSESVPREERDRRRAKEGEEYRRRQAEAVFRGRREGRARLENAAPPPE